MWPLLLDLTKDECKRMLRRLELEAYSSIITAFRAQGELSKDKKKVLQDLGTILGISTERHRAEIRRAVNDEHLATIADQVGGCGVSSEWAMEGRRLVPLMPRLVPQTAFSVLANSAANVLAAQNAFLPVPASTSNKRENNFSIPASVADPVGAKTFDAAARGVSALSPQDGHVPFERENPTFLSPMPSPEEIFSQPTRFNSSRSGGGNKDGQANMVVVAAQCQAAEMPQLLPLPPPLPIPPPPSSAPPTTSASNLVILPGRTPIGVRDGEKGRRYRRSSSTDTLVTTTVTTHKVPHPTPIVQPQQTIPSSHVKGVAPLPVVASPRTVSIPIGGAPVQFTVQGGNQKSVATSVGSSTSPPQKVILVSTTSANIPSSILQRSLGVPVVKTVSTSSGAAAPTATKTTSFIASTSVSITSTCSTLPPHSPSGATPTFSTPPIMSASTAVGSRDIIAPASGPAVGAPLPAAVGTSHQVAAQSAKLVKRTLVPVTSQVSTSTSTPNQAVQIKTTAGHGKPSTALHLNPEGLKFITHTLSTGTKLVPKSSGPPIMVVTKTGTTLTQSSQSGTRLVNVLTTQSSTGKLIVPTTLTVSRTSGNPTLVTVGSKGKQAALVKVSPAMSLSTAGGKPNVILVQKAHVVSHSTTGNTITVSASSLSAAAQTVLKSASGTTITYDDKNPKQSTVLADILQAAGILTEGSTAGEVVVGRQPQSDGANLQAQNTSSVSKMVPSGSKRKLDGTQVSAAKIDQNTSVVGLVVNPTDAATTIKGGRTTSMNTVKTQLPLEIQDSSGIVVASSGKLITGNLPQSNVQPASSLPADATVVVKSEEVQMKADEKKIVTSECAESMVADAVVPEETRKTVSVDDEVATVSAVSIPLSTSTSQKPKVPVYSPASLTRPVPILQAKLETVTPTQESGELDPQTGLFRRADGDRGIVPGGVLLDRKRSSANCQASQPSQLPSTSSSVVQDASSKVSSSVVRTALAASRAFAITEKSAVVQHDDVTSTKPETFESTESLPKTVCAATEETTGSSESQVLFADPSAAGGSLCDVAIDRGINRTGSVTTTASVAAASRDALSKLLYRGATYSREDAAWRKRHSTAESITTASGEQTQSEKDIMTTATPEAATPVMEAMEMSTADVISAAVEAEENITCDVRVVELLHDVSNVTAESTSIISTDFDKLATTSAESLPEMPSLLPEEIGAPSEKSPIVFWPTTTAVSFSKLTSQDPSCKIEKIAPDATELSLVEEQALLIAEGDALVEVNSDLIESLVANPNVTVELLPVAPFEYTSSLSQAPSDTEAQPATGEETFVQDAAEAVVVGEEIMFPDVTSDHITFSDEVVTVELEYDSIAVDQFVTSEVVGDVVFDSDDGLDAMLEHLDPERGGGQVEEEDEDDTDAVTEDVSIPGVHSDDLTLDPEMARAVSESLCVTIDVDSAGMSTSVEISGSLHAPDSSMFMVTESVECEEPTEHEIAYKTESLFQPSSEPPGASRQLIEDQNLQSTDRAAAEVLSLTDGQPTEGEFLQPSTSCLPLTPGKRKRKPSTIYSPEESLNIPHLSGWARSAMGLLLRVTKFRGHRKMKGDLGASHWFLNPVTPEEAPFYHQVVHNPMDFSTIKTKLETLCYKNISDFHTDMMLVKANCEEYNPPEHEARKDCEEVFNFYVQEYDRLIEKWQKAHLFSSSSTQKKPKLSPNHNR